MVQCYGRQGLSAHTGGSSFVLEALHLCLFSVQCWLLIGRNVAQTKRCLVLLALLLKHSLKQAQGFSQHLTILPPTEATSVLVDIEGILMHQRKVILC